MSLERAEVLLSLKSKSKEELKTIYKEIKKLFNVNTETKLFMDLDTYYKLEVVIEKKCVGRPSIFTDAEIETMKMYRLQGKTYEEISKIYECSKGTVYKYLNQKKAE